MTKSMEILAEEISAQAKVFELYGKDIIDQVNDIFDRTDLASKIEKVYITGCGDSFHAGLACRELFTKYTKMNVEIYQAIEFSRYICPSVVDEKAVVLSISSSGRVSRTVECALRAKEKNAFSIGVTSNPDSKLAKSATEPIVVKIPAAVGVAPGTQSYIASQLAIICFAIVLGKRRGVLSEGEADAIFAYISELGNVMRETVNANFGLIEKYIKAYSGPDNPNKIKIFHILGSGPNWGTALFGSMKLLEASGFDAIPQYTEEWAHAQYFTTKPGTHVIVLAPKGESRSRALEVLQAVSVMDGKKIVIGEEGDEELERAADIYLPICGMKDIKEEFTQLVYPIPLEIIALHMVEALGIQPFEFETKPWRKAENFRQIFGSEIVSLKQ